MQRPTIRPALATLAGLLTLQALSIGCADAQTVNTCGLRGGTRVYALSSDNSLYLFTVFDPTAGVSTPGFTRLGRVDNISGNLIGIDARPSDGTLNSVYGVTSTGRVYRISLNPLNLSAPVLVSNVVPRFAAGTQGLVDFNPLGAQNALRLIGSNDQNLALVNSAGTLDLTVQQTRMAYAAGDLNAGVDPNLTAGAYDNNVAGATTTTFFGIDYDLNTLVTIADRNAGGSSNTAGGQLRTIGPLVDSNGSPLIVSPNAGMDIYTQTDAARGTFHTAVLVTDRFNQHGLYCSILGDANQPVGTPPRQAAFTSTFIAGSEPAPPARTGVVSGSLIDVAVVPAFPQPPNGFSISGIAKPIFTFTPPGVCIGATITLRNSNGATLTTVSASNGFYSFTGLANGAYTVSGQGTQANPTPPVAVDGASVTGVDLRFAPGCP